ncbi:coiled-coil domain-containing protein 114 [Neoarius graeffei]|uniref:coiled-coil domain-containing protein 114 n=1 Tax=Neoarius graeffei TaxID=443677 RepID=UPI00298D3FBE|nr:coiled-coil domain-containing protein 114 [Neoarius graeffei]
MVQGKKLSLIGVQCSIAPAGGQELEKVVFRVRGIFKGSPLQAQLAKLQRQLRVMEADRQTYRIQSQELIRRQRLEIEKLCKEYEEVQKSLHAAENRSCKQTDTRDTRQIRALLDRCNELNKQLQRDQLSQAEREREIQSMQKRLDGLRKLHTLPHHKFQARYCQKVTRTLENKLNLALIHFNQQLVKNNQLRKELEILRTDHGQFQLLKHKLEKVLQEIHREIADVGLSTEAYDARHEAQMRLTTMKEKAEKELAQCSAEMKELERQVAHDQRLKDFMSTKSTERSNLEDSLSYRYEMKKQRRPNLEPETVETQEEVFKRLQKMTGEDDLEMLITKFIQDEDKNFALFNYVNEQNTQAEALKAEINKIADEMESFQMEALQQEQEHHTALSQMEEQRRDAEAQALEYEAQAKELTIILDQLKAGVSAVFDKLSCDRAAVDDFLGASAEITDSNIMTYLRLVEKKTNELLTMQAFIKSRDEEKEYDLKLVGPMLLGQSIDIQKQAPVMQPAVLWDDHDAHELAIPHEDERPLTKEEIHQGVMMKVRTCVSMQILQKDKALHAGMSKEARSAKVSALSSHREDTPEPAL